MTLNIFLYSLKEKKISRGSWFWLHHLIAKITFKKYPLHIIFCTWDASRGILFLLLLDLQKWLNALWLEIVEKKKKKFKMQAYKATSTNHNPGQGHIVIFYNSSLLFSAGCWRSVTTFKADIKLIKILIYLDISIGRKRNIFRRFFFGEIIDSHLT